MSLFARLDQKIAANGDLIVSCQPVPDSPFDKLKTAVAMASAAEQAGVVATRTEDVTSLQTTYAAVSVPIIGIVKCGLEDSPVRITVYIEDVDVLAQAGAGIITIDGTDRPRPMPAETLLARVHHHGLLAVTDCSTPEDGLVCQKLGAEIIGTMLSGYTTSEMPEESDLALVEASSDAGCRVIAGGRYDTPARATDTMRHSAWAVTVGSAVTHLEHICQQYNTTMKKAVL